MKACAFLAAVFATIFSFQAAAANRENFCPHFPADTPIIWQATNQLPPGFWIYKRLPPHAFSATVISNAVILASLQSKGFPVPSTNDFFISEDKGANYQGPIPVIFEINPATATLSYFMPHPDTDIFDIPTDDILQSRAWACALQLGVDPRQVILKKMTSDFNWDQNDGYLTNQVSGRGVYLSRLLDGITFTDIGNEAANGGFWIEFGRHGQIRDFSLVWPNLKREVFQATASPRQIIACIRAFKTMTLPLGEEPGYFTRLKHFSEAKKVIVTKITPYFREGIYGEWPANDEPPQIIAPFAELEAVVDYGTSNAPVKLLSPILGSEVSRLLAEKNQ
jgi:hypothetical protein